MTGSTLAYLGMQDFKGAAALSAEAKTLAGQAELATAKAKELRQQVSHQPYSRVSALLCTHFMHQCISR